MGGNALKNTNTKRLTLSELKRVQSTLSKTLTEHNLTHTVPVDLPGKTTFGDVDVLVSLSESTNTSLTRDTFLAWLRSTFAPHDYFVNGDVHSFAYEGQYQVDFILVDNLAMAKFYFSYGDVGAVLGHLAKAHGLSYGHKGLSAYVDDHVKVRLIDNPTEVCEYLGLSMEMYTRGFTTLAEVNQWVTGCRLYHPSLFERLRSYNESRQILRPFYVQFLEHALTTPSNDANWVLTKLNEHAVEYFGKQADVAKHFEEKRLEEEFRVKFNAQLFMSRGVAQYVLRKAMREFAMTMDVRNATVEELNVAVELYVNENRERLNSTVF